MSTSTIIFRTRLSALAWLAFAALAEAQTAAVTVPDAVFSVQVDGQQAWVRALTHAARCPDISWDGNPPQSMALRAPAQTIAARGNASQADSKPAVFDVLSCEAAWPANAKKASIAGKELKAPAPDIRRIVIIADTGCRMKGSESAFQACNDPLKWPFAKVAQSAAAKNPDLVIHIGDVHYRESPCPTGNTDCVGSAWGYGYDAWQADFFKPAAPLLAAAPWVFVRGNHESCFRAGQGWFRFLDAQPWSEARSCNQPALDAEADYSPPRAVAISPETQLLVFDSSKTSGKPFSPKDPAYVKYQAQLRTVQQLARQKQHSFFLSHHPLLAVAPPRDTSQLKNGGNPGLLSAFEPLYPQRLLPEGVDASMHGHLHFFEAISFKTAHPASLVMGNSGSANEANLPTRFTPGEKLHGAAIIEDYAATAAYGFATLEKISAEGQNRWLLTEYDIEGEAVFSCTIENGKSKCVKLVK